VLRPVEFFEVVVERNVAEMCGFPTCEKRVKVRGVEWEEGGVLMER